MSTRFDLDALRRRPAGELTPSELAALLGSVPSPARAASGAANGPLGAPHGVKGAPHGVKGGRPLKPLKGYDCTCTPDPGVWLAPDGRPAHPTTCPRGRAIRRRLARSQPLA